MHWKFKWLIGALVFFGLGAQASVVKPTWTTVLKERMQVRPGLAVWFRGKLVFSEWRGRRDCLARDLYSSAPLSQEDAKLELEVDCVRSLSVGGDRLWVETSDGVYEWEFGGELKKEPSSPPASLVKRHDERLDFSLAMAGVDASPRELARTHFNGYWLFQDEGGALRFLDLMGPTQAPYPVKTDAAFIRGARRVWMHDSRNHLFVERQLGSFTQWLVLPLKSRKAPFVIGRSTPMGRRSQAPLSEVAFRQPRFVQPTEEGLLVWEGSDNVRDNRGLFHLSLMTESAQRVWIPNDRYLTGVQEVMGGILVSQARPAQIRWYGGEEAKKRMQQARANLEWQRNSMVPVSGGSDE